MKRKLNLDKLKNRKHIDISSKEALKNIVPIKWSKDILSGKKLIIM